MSYHYRGVPEELHDELSSAARKIIQSYGYVHSQAHLAIEAKPPVHWNKGEAALLILKEEFGDDWWSHVKVVFAGDDNTDEDAMNVSSRMLLSNRIYLFKFTLDHLKQALKDKGMTFRVSDSPTIKTYADFRVPSTKTISHILQWLVDRS